MSARGRVPGLGSPYPVAGNLPGIYQEYDFVWRFTQAFDEAMAPVFAALDNLGSYVDPTLAPVDFLDWLAGWVGVATYDTGPIERRRELVARAVELYRWRGTVRGVGELVRLHAGVEPEIVDSGGTSWSAEPESRPPGGSPALLVVRLRVADGGDIDLRRLDRLVAAAKPAHIPHRIEVIS